MSDLLPTTFLPHLPRTQSTFSPLQPAELLGHIAVLRRLYLPPIHGGLRASDAFYEDEEDWRGTSQAGPSKPKSSAGRPIPGANGGDGKAEGSGLGLSTGLGSPISGVRLAGVGQGIPEEEEDEDDTYDSDNADEEDWEETPESVAHLDTFERDWAQKWLEGLFRRAQTWIEENDPGDEEEISGGGDEDGLDMQSVEAVLRDATAALAMMAGTSAAGSLTRHLLFPVNPYLAPALHTTRSQMRSNPNLSPETRTFLASLSTSPVSPLLLRRLSLSSPPRPTRRRASTALSTTSEASSSASQPAKASPHPRRGSRKQRPAIPVLLHDAPMGDHLSVGVQTWGSAILLGREMALRPERFGLGLVGRKRGVRVLELGAGTGLLSILCRKILDVQALSRADGADEGAQESGLVVATDFLSSVLDNLRVCVDLNFPPSIDLPNPPSASDPSSGIHIAKLDWTTFPAYASQTASERISPPTEEMARFMDEPFDLVLASDCVYDPTHAEMLRQVAGWVLRLPDPDVEGDQGGTFHILSPLRPTFAPELESIDTHFPTLSSYARMSSRKAGEGEGLGIAARLKLGVRGEGKRSVRGRKGEGRGDETLGYWWWEVGWG